MPPRFFCSVPSSAVKADVIPSEDDCHHIFLDDWKLLEEAEGVLFVSIPSLLDKTLCPEGTHIVHIFTPDWMDNWKGLSPEDYEARKERVMADLMKRMEVRWPGITDAVIFKYGAYLHPSGPRATAAQLLGNGRECATANAGCMHRREIGSPKTHRRFLNRLDGTYGPIPSKRLNGMLAMPLSRTDIDGLYCCGDSTFPGQVISPSPPLTPSASVDPLPSSRLASSSCSRCLFRWCQVVGMGFHYDSQATTATINVCTSS